MLLLLLFGATNSNTSVYEKEGYLPILLATLQEKNYESGILKDTIHRY